MNEEDTIEAEAFLSLNGQAVPCPSGLTLAELLKRQRVEDHAVTTAVNGAFVPRDQRSATSLVPGDRVLTFQPIVGG